MDGFALPLADPLWRPPPGVRRRTVVIERGRARGFVSAEWRDALVIVRRGHVVFLSWRGTRHAFEAGAVVWLDGLPVHSLHNVGAEPVVLVAVSRVLGRSAAHAG